MEDYLQYTSPTTNSLWEIYFDEDCEVTHVRLNGVNVTPRIIKRSRKSRSYHRSYIARLIELKFQEQMEKQMDELLYEKRSRRHFFEPEY